MLETPKDRRTHEVKYDDMITMDNQQETLNSWLAGIIDGEGNIMIHVNQHKKCNRGNPRPQLTPRLQIGSTSSEIIEKTKQAVRQYTGCLVKDRILPSGKLFQTVHVVGMKRMESLIPHIMPYLTLKQTNAERVMDFIRSRKSKQTNATYTEYEWALAAATKNGSSETNTQSSKKLDEDRVHSIVKAIE